MVKLDFQDLCVLKEIRVCLKEELGEKLLLSDPDLYSSLVDYWHRSGDPLTKSRIRSFLNEKNVSWDDPLD